MSVAPYILTRPTFSITPSIVHSVETAPTLDAFTDPTLRGLLGFLIPVTILLDALVEDIEGGRSLGKEQYDVYRHTENQLSREYGIDGQICILRFICELQRRPISQWTVAGQLLTTLFTPSLSSKKDDPELLMEYRAAQKVGLKEELDCGAIYKKCPFSVFGYYEAFKNVTSV